MEWESLVYKKIHYIYVESQKRRFPIPVYNVYIIETIIITVKLLSCIREFYSEFLIQH